MAEHTRMKSTIMEEGYCGDAEGRANSGGGKSYRKIAAVLMLMGISMVICAKVSISSQRAGGFSALAETVLSAHGVSLAGGAAFEGSAAQNADAEAAKKSMFASKVGWTKDGWTAADWMSWVIPGPIVTVIATGFIFGMYGPAWAAVLFVLLVGVDIFSYYVNI